jgi:hypothetical protein
VKARDRDPVLVVLAACVVALVLLLAGGVLSALRLDGLDVRTRILLVASPVVGPPLGVLVVLAAGAALVRGRARRVVQLLSAVLVALAVAEVAAYLTLDTGTVNGVGLGTGPKVGAAAYIGASGLLAGLGLWWTTARRLSAGGSRPGGGSA